MNPGPCANRVPGIWKQLRGSSSGPGRVLYTAETPVRIWSPVPSFQSSGSVTALTAADPDHNRGGKPTVMTAKRNIADSPRYFQRSGPALPQRDGVSRHELF